VSDLAPTAEGARLRERREAVVREHMESENDHDFDTTIGTFAHPRYELIPTGDVYDGEAEVRRYYAESRAAFPDQRNELLALHHADDAVIVEFDAPQPPPDDRPGSAAGQGRRRRDGPVSVPTAVDTRPVIAPTVTGRRGSCRMAPMLRDADNGYPRTVRSYRRIAAR
jgi:hypothetical protein